MRSKSQILSKLRADGHITDEEYKMLEQEPCEDAISRQAVIDTVESWLSCDDYNEAERHIMRAVQSVLYDSPPVNPQPKTGQYEKHIDHTDCIWYGNDSGCPVTCSQYRDGWNDAMDYIFKNGKGYQPYRHDVEPQESERV